MNTLGTLRTNLGYIYPDDNLIEAPRRQNEYTGYPQD